jgi:hypothetical protein
MHLHAYRAARWRPGSVRSRRAIARLIADANPVGQQPFLGKSGNGLCQNERECLLLVLTAPSDLLGRVDVAPTADARSS